MVGVPVASIVIIFAVGQSGFYIIDHDTTEENRLYMDRRASQAQLAVMLALEAEGAEVLVGVRRDGDGKMQQAWGRITG